MGKAITTIGALLLVLAGISAAQTPASAPETQGEFQFTIATFNINYINRDLAEVVKSITKADADLVCLQEMTADAAKHIRKNLAKTYKHIKFKKQKWAGGFGFLSKYPLDSLKWVPMKHGFFGAWICYITADGKKIQVMNMHLYPTMTGNSETLVDYLREYNRCEKIRAKEIVYFGRKLKVGMPTIITGDMNSLSKGQAPSYLRKNNFIDAAAITEKPDEQPTWHWNWKDAVWRYRIDYIFLSNDFKAVTYQVIENDKPSDHYLVFSKLTWNDKAGEEKNKSDKNPATKPDTEK